MNSCNNNNNPFCGCEYCKRSFMEISDSYYSRIREDLLKRNPLIFEEKNITITLDKIRELLKAELKTPRLNLKDSPDVEEAQLKINDWYYSLGRESMLYDILKWEQGLSEREFQIRKKKGTL